jgi:DNA-binding FadR family transcriptional regulator
MPKASSLLVNRIASQLREEVLAAPAGAFLGSEAELVGRFDVSRPTFRQAAKLLEQEQLLVVKPGIRGGYFSRQPDSAAVAHMTNLYLQSRNATVEHVFTIFTALYVMVAGAAAAGGRDRTALNRFIAFVQGPDEAVQEQGDFARYVESQAAMVQILADLSGNPLMVLFFTITREMLTPYLLDAVPAPAPELIARAQATRLQLLQAVRDGEPARSEQLARKYLADVGSWTLAGRTTAPLPTA